ncbi:GntR family transcriptional regulator [Isoptericola dokdonensis]|uniref:Colanic acid/biofilm transcriptional regulator n=1 Tax=Isoptericola dokdonensis DS-3 TaxID=1300344 RepID=A0A161IMX8_9MICO|nr:GntR family transcriptional regulator [Isoptericola dokdonensis]ANC31990.1 colanic acid/biofilm transcriptional regulator [Isoptericola dokdonensis DS-3]
MAASKADQCYEILRQGIMEGTFAPGHRLVIDQLARDHGISSVPWREAIRRLEAEGWVDIVRNAGAVVKTFDTGSWERTMQLLARLEGYATALSAPHLTRDELDRARTLNRAMGDALHGFDPARFGELNREFHQLLCSRCDDARLAGLVSDEWTRLELIRRSAFWYAPGRALASLAEHDGLIDLIEGGADPDVIENAARRHELNTVMAIHEHERQHADDPAATH